MHRSFTSTILLTMAFIAVSVFSLLFANYQLAAWWFTAVWMVLLIGATAGFVRRRSTRAYWIGFTVFGVGYFWLSLFADGGLRVYPDRRIWHEPKLPTTHLLFWVEKHVYRDQMQVNNTPNHWQHYHASGMGIIVSRDPSEYFVQVGQCLFTLAFALFGGWLGKWIYRGDMPREAGDPLSRG